jgi:hypothetical protein
MKVRALDSAGLPIDHSSMRFRRVVDIAQYPRVGDVLDLPTISGRTLHGIVRHVELDEPRSLFVLSCEYAERSISPHDYAAFSTDPEWQLRHLLE